MKIRRWMLWVLSLPLLLVAAFGPVTAESWAGATADMPGWMLTVYMFTFAAGSVVIRAFTPVTFILLGWCAVVFGLLLAPLLLFTRLRRTSRRLHRLMSGMMMLLFLAVPVVAHFFWPGEVAQRFGYKFFIGALVCQSLALLASMMEAVPPPSVIARDTDVVS